MQTRPVHPRELTLHDQLNLLMLPILTLSSLAGLLGFCDAYWVTVTFMAYVAFDFAWLWLYPTSVPSLANVILAHHLVTFILLTFAFRHPQFGHFTCWDGLTELNTWLLVLRRQWGKHRQLLNSLYWLTFIPQRLLLYPALLGKFWFVLEGFPLSERVLVCTCQFLLCCFNFGVFYLSIVRRSSKGAAQKSPLTAILQPAQGSMPLSKSVQVLKPARMNVIIRAHSGAVS